MIYIRNQSLINQPTALLKTLINKNNNNTLENFKKYAEILLYF